MRLSGRYDASKNFEGEAVIHRQIEVELGERTYPIYVGSGMGADFAPTLRKHGVPSTVVVITDSNVAPRYLKPIEKNLRHFEFNVLSVIIPPGEHQKSLSRANSIFTQMLKNGVGRKSAVIALGGGVIGDLAGFVAATYHRGLTLIQVPTTLLSQVDSSVGGKVAVNHPLGKNMIGVFYQPTFVWTDADCLQTLPAREVVCGLGEIVKYGIIWDEGLFRFVEENLDQILALDSGAVLHVQARCCEIKAQITSEDEREIGIRVVLNYGHTVGHALESAGKYRLLKHGEAVLLGMKAESLIARSLGLIAEEKYQRIVGLIRRIPSKANLSSLKQADILSAMTRDKKSLSGKTRFVLPTDIGRVQVVESVGPSLIRSSLQSILQK